MTARERYYLNDHLHRLFDWQLRQAAELKREQIIRRREFRRAVAYMYLRRALNVVIADNLKLYNRTKNWNF
jgi:hypothetical protein